MNQFMVFVQSSGSSLWGWSCYKGSFVTILEAKRFIRHLPVGGFYQLVDYVAESTIETGNTGQQGEGK